jgi:hypothetical protein
LTKFKKYNNLRFLYFFFERTIMCKGNGKLFFSVITILLISCMIGCLNKKNSTDRLYYEPPQRLINDYRGMVSMEGIEWTWLKLGVRFGNYDSISLKPFQNLTLIDDQNISEGLYEDFMAWFEKSDLTLDNEGEIICEVAIVDLIIEREFLNRVNPFYEENIDLLLEIELIITERDSRDILCKIRHATTASEVDMLAKQLVADLIVYFDSHM